VTPSEAAIAMESVRRNAQGSTLRLVAGTEVSEATGTGADLRDMRQARGLSVVQVAEALLLKSDQVSAIEAMDFSRLPGLGYALGYVRAYAELVQAADVDHIVNQFRAEWAPLQTSQEKTRKTLSHRFAVPLLVVVCSAAALWLVVWASMHAFTGGPADDVIAPPDAAIQEWAGTAPALPARGVAVVEPRSFLRAARAVRVELRGADGALVIDRTMRAGEEISTDGLGQWFLSTPDAGALEAHGYGMVVPVGENGVKADWWRVPDLAAMADAKAKEVAAEQDDTAAATVAAGAPPAQAEPNTANSPPAATATTAPAASPTPPAAPQPAAAPPPNAATASVTTPSN
jgi:Helix-turn-helix domain